MDKNVPPKYCNYHPLPCTLKTKVEVELDRLIAEGFISPVTHSDWAAAIVPVLKPDDTVRICGDYKLTVNKATQIDPYPIPRLEDLFTALGGGQFYSKLDMTQAYSQLVLDESSRPYTTINTHHGLFQYK